MKLSDTSLFLKQPRYFNKPFLLWERSEPPLHIEGGPNFENEISLKRFLHTQKSYKRTNQKCLQ